MLAWFRPRAGSGSRGAALLAVLALGVTSMTSVMKAQDRHLPVLPPHATPFGQSYDEWSARWWQYVYSIPAAVNPLVDETGNNCAQGQRGRVWFLTGVFNETGVAVRDRCIVPAGTALFVPIVNVECNTIDVSPPEPISALRAQCREAMDSAAGLSLEVNGVVVPHLGRFRVQSPVFSITLPLDNILEVPAGTYRPSVADGYYVMLAPLPPGRHTVRFRGALTRFGFSLDVAYHLTVAPARLGPGQ